MVTFPNPYRDCWWTRPPRGCPTSLTQALNHHYHMAGLTLAGSWTHEWGLGLNPAALTWNMGVLTSTFMAKPNTLLCELLFFSLLGPSPHCFNYYGISGRLDKFPLLWKYSDYSWNFVSFRISSSNCKKTVGILVGIILNLQINSWIVDIQGFAWFLGPQKISKNVLAPL